MNTENLSTLKIHKLTQEQYDREVVAGRIDETAMYLTPEEEITAEKIGAATKGELTNHTESTDNPHDVTAEQIGALTPSAFSYDPDTHTLYINTQGVI